MLTRKPFFYLRHGETDWNRQGLYQGQQDVPLNATGIGQAQAAKNLLRGQGIATICASPLSRAHGTAEIINEVLSVPLIVIDGLQECSFGQREGQAKSGPDGDAAWRQGATLAGEEPYADFAARVLEGINRALAYPGPVLIVAHRAVYWPVEVAACLTDGGDLPNAHPVRFDPPRQGADTWCARLLRQEPPES